MLRLALAFWLLAAAAATAAPVVREARIMETAPGQRTTIATFTVTNRSETPDRLLMVYFKLARSSHIVRVKGLRTLKRGIHLGPGETVRLTPVTVAVLLTRLRDTVKKGYGEPYEAVLKFQKAGDLRVRFTPVAVPAPLTGRKMPGPALLPPGCCRNNAAHWDWRADTSPPPAPAGLW